MSSSKVYKQSSDFQPEDIVKNKKGKDLGWSSTKFTDSDPSEYSPAPIYQENLNSHVSGKQREKAPTPHPETADNLEEIISKKNTSKTSPKPEIKESQPAPPPQPETLDIESDKKVQQLIKDSYNQGISDGLQQAGDDYKSGTATLIAISEQLNTTREMILQNSIGEMQDLVLTIAEKVIRHSLTAQDDTIIATVEEAMRQTIKSDEFYVCVNQKDYDIIHKKSPELVAQISGLDNIVIKIDNAIEPGGCKVESDYCTVDATIASQLQIITDHVKSRR